MASQTIARLYDNYDIAADVIRELQMANVSDDDIGVVTNAAEGDRFVTVKDGNDAVEGAEIGAGVGALAGGGAGVLAGLGMLAIPGIGPVVAAGWLAALAVGALGGAAAGGLLGGLVGSGISKEHAEVYTEGVRRGGTLVSVRTSEADAPHIAALMAPNAIDPAVRRTEYTAAGWDPDLQI